MSARRIGRAAGATAVISSLVGIGSMVHSPAGAAPADIAFRAVAEADGLRVTMYSRGAPLTPYPVDTPGPSAQAAFESAGPSKAFASFPYPGHDAATASGTVRQQSGAPFPDYPFYASSSYPAVPIQETGTGAFGLKAESTETSSTAVARLGAAPKGVGALGTATSQAAAGTVEGTVAAAAASEVSGFAVGPLRIGELICTAEVRLDDAGRLVKESDTRLLGAKVGDTPVTLTAEGLSAADGNLAGPDLSAIEAVLEQAKINVELMRPEDPPGGVVAPALRIKHELRPDLTVTYVLGGAAAFLHTVESSAAVTESEPEPARSGEPAPTGSGESEVIPGDGQSRIPPRAASSDAARPGNSTPALRRIPPVAPVGRFPTTSADPDTGEEAAGVAEPAAAASTSPVASSPQARASAPDESRRLRLARQVLAVQSNASPLFLMLAGGAVLALSGAVGVRSLKARPR